MQGQQFGGADLRGHVGQLERHPLIGADRLAELFAVRRPLQGDVQCPLSLANAVGSHHHPAGGKPGIGHFPALADFAQHLAGRDPAVIEEHLVGVITTVAHALGAAANSHARGATVNQEGGDRIALLAVVFIGVGHREDNGEIGMPGMADEMLAAIEDKMVALTHGAGLDGIGVGTGARFGQGKTVDLLTLDARQQVVVDLLILARHKDLRGARDKHMHRPGHLGQLALDQRLRHVI
ncbi:hypothetical protein D3C81_960970 [compost metagenome]